MPWYSGGGYSDVSKPTIKCHNRAPFGLTDSRQFRIPSAAETFLDGGGDVMPGRRQDLSRGLREILIDLDLDSHVCRYARSCVQSNGLLAGQLRRVRQHRPDRVCRERWILREKALLGHPSSQIVQNDRDGDPRTCDTRNAVHHIRVN